MNTAVMNQRNVVSEGVSRRSIPFLRAALIAFLVFAAYYIGSKIGHTLRFPDTSLSVIWPPSAVLFAALLLSPARLWPGLLLVTLPAHIAVHAHARIDTWMILWFYLFNCALSLLSALAVRRFVDARLNFSDLKHTITYLIVGVVACPAIVSLVSAAVKVYGKSDANIWDYWRVSYLSNALAYLTIAPAIVTGYTGGADFFRSVTRQRILEAVILAVSFLVACGLVFGGQISESIALAALLFAPLPFLLWAAIRFGPGGCSFALLTLTLISCWSAVNGHFLFNESSQSKTVLSVQMFLIAISTSVLLLAALTEERHQSAQRLRKNETQYRAIVEDQTELICRFRPDGTLTFVNSAYCNFFGKHRDELVGHNFLDLLPEDDRIKARKHLDSISSEQPMPAMEHKVIAPGGEIRWQRWIDRAIFDENGNLNEFQSVGRDITDRKVAEDALRESEKRFRTLISDIHVGVLLQGVNAEILMSNQAALELLGLSEEQLIGKTSFDPDWNVIHEDGTPFPGETHPVPRAIATGLPVRNVVMGVYRPTLKDRVWLLVDAVPQFTSDGQIVNVICTFSDITSRKIAEEALRVSEERFAKAFRVSPDAVSISRQLNSRVVEVNDSWEKLFEYTQKEVVGHTPLELNLYSDLTERQELLKKLKEQGFVHNFEMKLLKKSGEQRLTNISVESIIIGGEPCYLTVVQDITDRRRAEIEKRTTQELLQSTIDALSAHIAILDEKTNVIMVNESWRRYGDGNGFNSPNHGIGLNYLKVCDFAANSSDAQIMAEGMRAVLNDELDEFTQIYSCSLRQRAVWFMARVTRFKVGDILRLVVAHEDVTEIKEAEESLEHLTTRLMRLQDDERRRIARELHDDTAQNLFGIAVNLEALQQQSNSLPDDFSKTISDCQLLCERSLQEIRTLSYLLHPPLLEQAGLITALRWYTDGFTRRSGINVDLTGNAEIGRLPAEIELALFRVVQEALANVYRHSGGDNAVISLEKTPHKVVLYIKDNGRGIPGNNWDHHPENFQTLGVGILGMRQRLRQLGGRLKITSSKQGTTITAIVPLAGDKNGNQDITG